MTWSATTGSTSPGTPRLDSLLIGEISRTLTLAEREQAVDELLHLFDEIDELLAEQLDLDVESLERSTPRRFTEHERDEIRRHQARAYRWTFMVSGLEHPNFVHIVRQLTQRGGDKVVAAARALAAADLPSSRPSSRLVIRRPTAARDRAMFAALQRRVSLRAVPRAAADHPADHLAGSSHRRRVTKRGSE